jgi:hypothetical protein
MNPRDLFITALVCFAALLASCSRKDPSAGMPTPTPNNQTSAAAESKPLLDACALLTSEEIESVQGEPVQETKPTTQSAGGVATTQCYFALPTSSNSVILSVTAKDSATGDVDVKESWEKMFGEHDKAGEHEHEGEEEGEGKNRPLRIEELGEEAFWVGGHIGGAVYVLKDDRYIRLSVGGAGDATSKRNKSKILCEMVLKRL